MFVKWGWVRFYPEGRFVGRGVGLFWGQRRTWCVLSPMLECFRLVLSSAAFVGATAQEDESEGEKDQDGEIEGRGGVDGAASLGCVVLLFGREGVLCDDVGWKGFCGGCDLGGRFGWKGFC